MVAHHNRFDSIAVLQFPEVLNGTILRRNLLAQNSRTVNIETLRQLISKVLGNVRHIIKAANIPGEPLKDLLGTK